MDPVTVRLVPSRFLTRWKCHVCGGHTEKVPILAEVMAGEHAGFRVCEACIESRDFDQKLQAHAQELEEYAAVVRSLIGRLRVPTLAEYRAATRRSERRLATRVSEPLFPPRYSARGG